MTAEDIKTAFLAAIAERGSGQKIGLTKHQVYHYRHRTEVLSLGTMLEVLFKLNKLKLIA